MKLLHTSDWHVGKKIKGHSRAIEHEAVLDEIAAIAADEQVDLVLVAGDLFETAAPTPESESIVNSALLKFADIAPVIAIAGNHDNQHKFEALAPLLELGRITMIAKPVSPSAGGNITTVLNGETVNIAACPFVSQRAIVRADDLMQNAAYENAQSYGAKMTSVIGSLTRFFDADAVNIFLGHAFVTGSDGRRAETGGGERPAHLIDEYAVSAVDFPASANYVALGHLHRPQKVSGATAIHYCGSPIQLDFGEENQTKQVNIVDCEPGLPAKVVAAPLKSGKTLRTFSGTVSELAAEAKRLQVGEDARKETEISDDDWIRVVVKEKARSGLAEEIRELFGQQAVEIRTEQPTDPAKPKAQRSGKAPRELFLSYLEDRNVDDQEMVERFDSLLDELRNSQSEHQTVKATP